MIGQNIGKYRVLERVGRGGMGTVYRAIDETLHREVAIKVLNAELNDPAVARRFRAEAVTVARLNHPGIATIYELFQNEGQWLMVMEFVRGETLEGLVARKGALSIEEASELCMQALGGLAHAHGLGVVHRDLKPANLMITDAGTVKIMDFGIARVSGTEHLTSVGFMMGTPAYMAPEQVMGQDIDARSDLYAIGVVLFYLTTAKLPFKGDTPFEMAQSRIRDEPTPVRTVRAELPPWVAQVLDIALARSPERRFQSAPVFRESLRRGLANLPLETPASSSIPPELIATAAPRSIPIATPPPMPSQEVVRQQPIVTTPPVVAVPTPSAPPPPSVGQPELTPPPLPMPAAAVRPPAAPTAAVPATAGVPGFSPVPPVARTEPAKAGKSMTGIVAGAVIGVLLLAGGGWMWMRSRSAAVQSTDSQAAVNAPPEAPPPSAPPPPAPAASTPADGTAAAGASSSPAAAAPAGPAGTDTSPGTSPGSAGSAGRGQPASGTGPATSSSAAGAARGAGATTPGTPGAAGSAATTTPATPVRGARGARGRAGAMTNDPHLAFGDLHALVVNGKKADEQQVSVHFFSGQISVVAQRNGATLALVPYKDFVKATYVHAKSPKWDATLTAPPADVNMPGGLFSSARHWLTLQAKNTYVILRLNDEDYKKVLDTVTARMGLSTADTSGSS